MVKHIYQEIFYREWQFFQSILDAYVGKMTDAIEIIDVGLDLSDTRKYGVVLSNHDTGVVTSVTSNIAPRDLQITENNIYICIYIYITFSLMQCDVGYMSAKSFLGFFTASFLLFLVCSIANNLFTNSLNCSSLTAEKET